MGDVSEDFKPAHMRQGALILGTRHSSESKTAILSLLHSEGCWSHPAGGAGGGGQEDAALYVRHQRVSSAHFGALSLTADLGQNARKAESPVPLVFLLLVTINCGLVNNVGIYLVIKAQLIPKWLAVSPSAP